MVIRKAAIKNYERRIFFCRQTRNKFVVLSNVQVAIKRRAVDFDIWVQLARALIQTFLRHALRDGFFHADMHPGNLFVDDEGRLIAVDFGIMGRLGLKERLFLAEILHGFITRDYHRTAEVHFEAGYVPTQHSIEDFAQAIRAIGEPIHNRTAEDISMARLLALLFEELPSEAALAGPAGTTLARCAGAVDFPRLEADMTAACTRVRAWYDRLVSAPAHQVAPGAAQSRDNPTRETAR